jgi:RHS repeat-associated protein
VKYPNPITSTSKTTYPFGMHMPGRSFSSGSYRYGFNGKESDDEVSGTGNQYDYGFRIYNPRIGKFLSVDPLTASYPWYTPYQFAGNMPIVAIDIEGLEEYWVVARSFIPQPKLSNPDPLSMFQYPFFLGDNRFEYKSDAGKSFRTEQYANLDFNNNSTATNQVANSTTAIDSNGDYVKSSSPSTNPGNVNANISNNTGRVNFYINAKNKLASARNPFVPAINAKINVSITPLDDGSFNFIVDIPEIDGFPAYELWIIDEDSGKSYLLFGQNPIESRESPYSLYGSGEHSYYFSGNSKDLISKETISFEENPNREEK